MSMYEIRPHLICPLRLRMTPHMEALGMNLDMLVDNKVSESLPWFLRKPSVILMKKSKTI